MKLTRIHFDLYKSLINEVLDLNNNCTGIVGINESGKTNILNAIRVLNKKEKLGLHHQPKIKKDSNPKLRFEFELEIEFKNEILKIIKDWIRTNCLIDADSLAIDFNVEYIVEYDIEKEEEIRTFSIIDYKLEDEKLLILKDDFIDDTQYLWFDNEPRPLKEAMIINADEINKSNLKIDELSDEVVDLDSILHSWNEEIENIQDELNLNPSLAEEKEPLLIDLSQKIENTTQKKSELESLIDKIDLTNIKSKYNSEIENLASAEETHKTNIKSSKKLINELRLKPQLTIPEKGLLTKKINSKESNELSLSKVIAKIESKSEELNKINTPLKEKYSNDFSNLSEYVSKLISHQLNENLPKVVFWNYSDEYILGSETEFKDLLSKKSFSEIPRPLINVFRVGLGTNTIDELKQSINTIKSNPSERGRLEDTFNLNLNQYIKGIWGDYDQKLRIFLEEQKIRIQFFDPQTKLASYFDMNERSQGAQTFISFLMTIGAEAEKGVISNMILLLDEPEIHLHPSGVRFMLKELIKISKKNNVVIYATHSIFMIDRENFDRHVFLKKKNEKTSINPSRKERVGFFMQEEVLYKAINIDLSKDFSTSNVFNFVFEGDGDVVIFEKFYNLLNKNDRPFKIEQTSFYQGGKCSDIIKYFANNPIQLGSSWVFIIDKDGPAEKLKDFIEGKYRKYLNKDIFIFQYGNEKKKGAEIELEDLLSDEIVFNSYRATCEKMEMEVDHEFLKNSITADSSYIDYNQRILDKLNLNDVDKLSFKALFKEKLNLEISRLAVSANKIDAFKECFKGYSDWAESIVSEIKNQLKPVKK